jgi:hypothetical protein
MNPIKILVGWLILLNPQRGRSLLPGDRKTTDALSARPRARLVLGPHLGTGEGAPASENRTKTKTRLISSSGVPMLTESHLINLC